jgi:PAS domain S-box-containing protein
MVYSPKNLWLPEENRRNQPGLGSPKDLYTPEEYERFLKRHDKRLQGEPVSDDIETEIIRKDGVIRWVQTSRNEVLWNGQTQFQLLCIDITERK